MVEFGQTNRPHSLNQISKLVIVMRMYLTFNVIKIFLVTFSVTTWSAKPNAIVSVEFDHTVYQIEFTPKLFSYIESGRTQTVRIQDCNRSKIEPLEKAYRFFMASLAKRAPRSRTPYDVKVTTSGKTLLVARGSEFGNWLRAMPNNVIYIIGEAKAQCGR